MLLLTDHVFEVAGSFRPEATVLLATTAALYGFVPTEEGGRRRGYVVSGLLFGLGLLAKRFALLPWAVTACYVITDRRTTGKSLQRSANSGFPMSVRTTWRAATQPDGAYGQQMEVVDEGGEIVAAEVTPPAGGLRPTTSWRTGELIEDIVRLDIPDDLTPGGYWVLVGLYDATRPGISTPGGHVGARGRRR